MYKYTEFLTEKNFLYWESLELNESKELLNLIDSISHYLETEYDKNTDKFYDLVCLLFKRFKNRIKLITIIVGILASTYMSTLAIQGLLNRTGFSESETTTIMSSVKKDLHVHKNEIKKFLNALAESESTMDPKAINNLGYIGKYQFGEMALKDVDLDKKINTEKFRKNPKIWPEKEQDKAMVKLLKKNKQYLGNYIKKYDGKIIAGVKMTKSGLLAGSHLVGAADVKKFLDSNGKIVPKDGNNVPVSHYIQKFGGYDITI